MTYKIIAKEWRSAARTIGFIAYETGNPKNPDEWNAVVGYYPQFRVIDAQSGMVVAEEEAHEKRDAQYIAANGAKLSWQEARVIFPYLNITKFKYGPIKVEEDIETYPVLSYLMINDAKASELLWLINGAIGKIEGRQIHGLLSKTFSDRLIILHEIKKSLEQLQKNFTDLKRP